jgi:hypothetical protein
MRFTASFVAFGASTFGAAVVVATATGACVTAGAAVVAAGAGFATGEAFEVCGGAFEAQPARTTAKTTEANRVCMSQYVATSDPRANQRFPAPARVAAAIRCVSVATIGDTPAVTDELSEIQSLLMSDDHVTGRERLAAWLASLDRATVAKRELALRDLCGRLDVRSHQTRAIFCLAGGALTESGLDSEPLARAIIAPLTHALTSAKRLIALAADEPEDEEDAMLWVGRKGLGAASIERLGELDGEALDAFASLETWYRPFVATMTRALSVLRQTQKNEALVTLVSEMDEASSGVHWMYLLLKTMMDDELIVLLPELREGWRVKVSGCVDNGQLTTLLSDPLDASLAKIGASRRASKVMLDNARGLGEQEADGSYGASFHVWAWRAMDPKTGLPAVGRYEWLAPGGTGAISFPPDFLPTDIPRLDGERVALLVGPDAKGGVGYTRMLSATRMFAALPASLSAVRLAPADAERWLSRVTESVR